MATNKLKNTAGKSMGRLKSSRKPLRDVSSSSFGIKPLGGTSFKSKKPQPFTENDLIDRLLLIRSDFSSIVHQIDELVQVLKLGGKKSRNEIESFAHVLSEMQASLMPWVPKFQKALSDLSTMPEYPSEQSRPRESVPVVADNINNAVDSPEQSKWDSLVSPSPLVSWRAGCTTESGRQLFLLTPLPLPKGLSSKRQGSRKTFNKSTLNIKDQQHPILDITGDLEDLRLENPRTFPNIASATANQPTSRSNVNEEMDKLHVSNQVKANPDKVVSNTTISKEVTQKGELFSPPKTCVLLEPVSEYKCRDSHGAYKMTPFPVARHCFSTSEDSDSSSKDLIMKYAGKVADESPSWLVSPPMETNAAGENHRAYKMTPFPVARHCFSTSEDSDSSINYLIMKYGGKVEDESPSWLVSPFKTCVNAAETGGNIVESTPMMRESKSILGKGKHPGENTLKKELWEKFEAASTNDICFNLSTTQKGFLERLEEADAEVQGA